MGNIDCPPCYYDPDCPKKKDNEDTETNQNISQAVGCTVNTFSRQYMDDVIDLSVKVKGGTISVQRAFNGVEWGSDNERNKLEIEGNTIEAPIDMG